MQDAGSHPKISATQAMTGRYDGKLCQATLDRFLEHFTRSCEAKPSYIFVSRQGMTELRDEVWRYQLHRRVEGNAASIERYRGIAVTELPILDEGVLVFSDLNLNP